MKLSVAHVTPATHSHASGEVTERKRLGTFLPSFLPANVTRPLATSLPVLLLPFPSQTSSPPVYSPSPVLTLLYLALIVFGILVYRVILLVESHRRLLTWSVAKSGAGVWIGASLVRL